MGHAKESSDRFLETLQDYVTLQRVAVEFGLRMRGYRHQGRVSVVDTDEGAKEIRRLHHSPDEYRFACAAAEYLRGQGFSRLPRATWAPSGSPLVELDGALYTMRDWIHGIQADLDNVCQLTQAVEMLAWFHRCGKGFKQTVDTPVRETWGSWPARFAARIEESYHFEEQAKAAEDDRFARLFLKVFDDFLRDGAKALEELEAGPYQATVQVEREAGGLCHRDFTARNIVLRDDGSLYLTDFDDIAMDSRLEDLGRFLVRHGRWEVERSVFILQIYHGVNRLARTDVDCLLAYLRYPWEFWSTVNAHFTGKESNRRLLKHLASSLPARREYLAGLARMDWSFLAGGGPVYNLGFNNLAEVPPGKAWADGFRPAAEPAPSEYDWAWQAPTQDAQPNIFLEPSRESDWSGTVLEESGGGVGDSWTEAIYGPAPAVYEDAADEAPVPVFTGGIAGEIEQPFTPGEREEAQEMTSAPTFAAAGIYAPAEMEMPAPTVEAAPEEPEDPGEADSPPAMEQAETRTEPADIHAAHAPVARWRPFPAPLGAREKGAGRHG